VVTTRERLAHLDNGRLLSLFQEKNVPLVGIVENMTHMICPKCGELIEMYPMPASEALVYGDTQVLASVPFHPDLIRQNRGGPPLPLADPDSHAALLLLSLADQVMSRLTEFGNTEKRTMPVEDDCVDCP
jgi:ATP-binding protein involved in chromosome partitioning